MVREFWQAEMGPESNRLETPLQKDGVREVLENYLQSTRNPNLKLGNITDQGDAFEAEIVTKESSLVDTYYSINIFKLSASPTLESPSSNCAIDIFSGTWTFISMV
jgi:hypothetical protein